MLQTRQPLFNYGFPTKSAREMCYSKDMRYIFYADVYFIQNFMMKAVVLYLSLYFNKMQKNITTVRGLLKICIVSLIGTILEIVGFLFVNNYGVFLILVNVLEIPFMIKGIIGKQKIAILPMVFSRYFFTILINGGLEFLWNYWGKYGGYLFFLVFSCGAVIVGVRIWRNYTKMQKGIFQVEAFYQDKQIIVNAFYDSGNRLKDPYTGMGVHIISEQRLRELGGLKSVYIPYQSLGNQEDLLEVYYIDELIIEGEKGRITIQNCPLGVTKDNLFEGKNYEIILNEEVF